jgi:hypothetical protein
MGSLAAARDLDPERVSKTVHVGGIFGLGDDISETDLAEFFGQQGEVVAVRISGKFAWVEFADVRAAHTTLALDGETTGGHHLRVSQSKSAIHSNGLEHARRYQAQAAATQTFGTVQNTNAAAVASAAAAAAAHTASLQGQQQAGAAAGGYPGMPGVPGMPGHHPGAAAPSPYGYPGYPMPGAPYGYPGYPMPGMAPQQAPTPGMTPGTAPAQGEAYVPGGAAPGSAQGGAPAADAALLLQQQQYQFQQQQMMYQQQQYAQQFQQPQQYAPPYGGAPAPSPYGMPGMTPGMPQQFQQGMPYVPGQPAPGMPKQ